MPSDRRVEPIAAPAGGLDGFGNAEPGDPPVVEPGAHLHRDVDLERVAVGEDRDAFVALFQRVGVDDAAEHDGAGRGRRNAVDHHLAQKELDGVEVFGALLVVGVELGTDAFDRVGDAIQRLRQVEIVLAIS